MLIEYDLQNNSHITEAYHQRCSTKYCVQHVIFCIAIFPS